MTGHRLGGPVARRGPRTDLTFGGFLCMLGCDSLGESAFVFGSRDSIIADVVPDIVETSCRKHCFVDCEVWSLGDKTPDRAVMNDVPMAAECHQPVGYHSIVAYASCLKPGNDFLSGHADNIVDAHAYFE